MAAQAIPKQQGEIVFPAYSQAGQLRYINLKEKDPKSNQLKDLTVETDRVRLFVFEPMDMSKPLARGAHITSVSTEKIVQDLEEKSLKHVLANKEILFGRKVSDKKIRDVFDSRVIPFKSGSGQNIKVKIDQRTSFFLATNEYKRQQQIPTKTEHHGKVRFRACVWINPKQVKWGVFFTIIAAKIEAPASDVDDEKDVVMKWED
jgi:hypothetical protein